jgi:hypothetical protein
MPALVPQENSSDMSENFVRMLGACPLPCPAPCPLPGPASPCPAPCPKTLPCPALSLPRSRMPAESFDNPIPTISISISNP